MLFNNAKCQVLSPDYVNMATGLELHRFLWLGDDNLIGEIPHRWNHLVDYDDNLPVEDLSNLHFTSGGPYFEKYLACSYADVCFQERDKMFYAE